MCERLFTFSLPTFAQKLLHELSRRFRSSRKCSFSMWTVVVYLQYFVLQSAARSSVESTCLYSFVVHFLGLERESVRGKSVFLKSSLRRYAKNYYKDCSLASPRVEVSTTISLSILTCLVKILLLDSRAREKIVPFLKIIFLNGRTRPVTHTRSFAETVAISFAKEKSTRSKERRRRKKKGKFWLIVHSRRGIK